MEDVYLRAAVAHQAAAAQEVRFIFHLQMVAVSEEGFLGSDLYIPEPVLKYYWKDRVASNIGWVNQSYDIRMMRAMVETDVEEIPAEDNESIGLRI